MLLSPVCKALPSRLLSNLWIEYSMDPSRASKASNLESNFSIYVDRIWTVIGTSTDCAMGDHADLVGSITYKRSTLEYCTFVRKFSHLDM